MASVVFVQGNTGPDITATIHLSDPETSAVDLATVVTVKFQMRKSDDRRFTVNAAADVVNAGQGAVKYSWQTNDLSVPGDYECQWELTFLDGKVITTAHPNDITVRRA